MSSLMEKDKFQQVSVKTKSLTVTNKMLSLIPLCQGTGLDNNGFSCRGHLSQYRMAY